MIHIYAADIRHLQDPRQCPELFQLVDEKTKEKIMSYCNAHSRIEYLGFHLLLKRVAARHQIASRSDSTQRDESGYFSFSHSKNLIICALSEREIGCDIKKLENAPKKFPIHFFSPSERKYLNDFSGEAYDREFHRLWTIKESFINMTGESFSHPSKSIEFSINEDIEIRKEGILEDCWIEEYIIPGYKLSVCSKDSDFAPDVKFITII